MGANGNRRIVTPNLDRFAKEALVFDRCYPASFPTIPARADIHPGRLTFTYRGWQPLAQEEVTLAQTLHDGGYNKVIVRYGQFVQDLAQQQHVEVIDMNAPLVAVLEEAHLADPVLAEKIIPDRIHPSAAGGLVMAAAILEAWNAPAVVSEVEIDASRMRVPRREHTQITDLQKKPNLSWTQQDNALPMPFDPKDDVLALVLRSSNIVESLDQQLLKITGLVAPKYTLKIDGEEIGAWTREDLARGINLALLETPMLKQSVSVYAFSGRLHSLRMARWQGVQVALQEETSPHINEALLALDALDNELVEREKSAAVPKAHHYELLPAEQLGLPFNRGSWTRIRHR